MERRPFAAPKRRQAVTSLVRGSFPLALLLAGCVGLSVREAPPAPPPAVSAALGGPLPAPRAVAFCADGAGGYGGTSRALRAAFARHGVPVQVEEVRWSHGEGRVLADHLHLAHVRAEACRLAGEVTAWRRRHPGQPVYLVGHSAGSAVVLEATRALPPGGVERVVLLAPAVSADYDLRPALAGARAGVDVFCSDRDWVWLGLGVAVVGTTDRRWAAAAGRVGFRPVIRCPGDAGLYARLRQHRWDPCVAWTGNSGGHYGTYTTAYLDAYVLPLLVPPAGGPALSAVRAGPAVLQSSSSFNLPAGPRPAHAPTTPGQPGRELQGGNVSCSASTSALPAATATG
jgi:pimeloyl-ACP methyl ester carboxylesterase